MRSFDQLVIFLQDKSTIDLCQDCLAFVLRLSQCQVQSARSSDPERARLADPSTSYRSTGIVLRAYLLALHPARVFPTMNTVEQALVASAKRLLDLFERILSIVAILPYPGDSAFRALPSSTAQGFLDALADCRHGHRLLHLQARIRRALAALHRAAQLLPPGPPGAGPRALLIAHSRHLRERLAQIGATALALSGPPAPLAAGPAAGVAP